MGLAFVALFGGCSTSVHAPEGIFACTADDDCPPDFECRADDRCYARPVVDGATDGAVDAAADAPDSGG